MVSSLLSSVDRSVCATRRRSSASPTSAASAWRRSVALVPPQAGVAAAGGEQLVVGAALDDPAAVQDQDLVDALQAGQAVGDEDSVTRPSVSASRSAVRASAAAGRGARPARRGPGSGSRPAGPGPRRPAGAGRPRGGHRAARPSVARPSGRPASQPAESDPVEDRGAARRRWRRAARSAGSRPGWCRRGGRSARPARRRVRTSSPASRSSGTPSRDDRPGVGGQEAHAARRPGSTCRRRSGPTTATRRPGGEREVDAPQRGAAAPGSGPDVAQARGRGGRRAAAAGLSGSATGGGASIDLEDAAGGRATRWRAWVAAGQRRRPARMRPAGPGRGRPGQRAVEATRRDGARPRAVRQPQQASPASRVVRAEADARRRRPPPRRWRAASPSAASIRVQLAGGRPEDDQLGRPFDEVDDAGGELAPRGRPAATRARGPGVRSATGTAVAEKRGPRARTSPAAGQHPPHDARRSTAPTSDGHGEGRDDPEHQVLERVDVVDHPGHQVAAAERGQAGRRQPLEALVDADPQVGEQPERRIVTDQPLAVAEEAARQPEELHADDGQRRARPRTGAGRPGRSARPPCPSGRSTAPMAPAPSSEASSQAAGRATAGDARAVPARSPARGRSLMPPPRAARELDDPVGQRQQGRAGGPRSGPSGPRPGGGPRRARPPRSRPSRLAVGSSSRSSGASRTKARASDDALALAGRQAGAALAEQGRRRPRGAGAPLGRARPRRARPRPRRRWRRDGPDGRCRRPSGRRGGGAGAPRRSGVRQSSEVEVGQVDAAERRPRPRRGRRGRAARASSVDLPHPLGPASATVSPGSTARSAPCSAGSRRPG